MDEFQARNLRPWALRPVTDAFSPTSDWRFPALSPTIESRIYPWNTRFDHSLPATSQSFGKCFIKDYPLVVTTNLHARSCCDRSSHITPTAGAAWGIPELWRPLRKTDQWLALFGCVSRSTNLTHRRNSPLQ